MKLENNHSYPYFAWKSINIILYHFLYRYESLCTTRVGTLPSLLWSHGNCMEFGHSLVWYGVWRYPLWNRWTNMVSKLIKYFWTMLKMKFEFWTISNIFEISNILSVPAMPISHFEPECQLIAGTWFKAAWREVLRHVSLWRKYSTTDGWPLPQLLVGPWVPMGSLMREYPQGVHPLRDLLYMPGLH